MGWLVGAVVFGLFTFVGLIMGIGGLPEGYYGAIVYLVLTVLFSILYKRSKVKKLKKRQHEAENKLSEVQRRELENRRAKFQETKRLSQLGTDTVYLDESNKLFYVKSSFGYAYQTIIYAYDEVASYEEKKSEGRTITTVKKKHGLGRAAAGGLLFGGAGAIVGATTAKEEMETKTVDQRKWIEVECDSFLGHTQVAFFPGIEALRFIDDLVRKNRPKMTVEQKPKLQPISSADEIMKYKDLMDQGAITQEEFEKKKKQLLDI